MNPEVSVPEVSVIVPLYNKALWIDRCLDSIARQSFTDYEIIVVDDGSTDGGEKLVQKRVTENVRLIRQPNAGPGAARNHGVKEARGQLIAMLDADDAWEPEYLAESVGLLNAYGERAAWITWAVMELPAGISSQERWKRLGVPEGFYRLTPETPLQVLLGIVANIFPSSTVIRRDVFLREGGFYARTRCLYGEDTYLWLKVLMHEGVAFDGRALVRRHCDASELTTSMEVARPIEPFLLDDAELRGQCPPALAPLLHRFLASRAAKTASVYGYFGHPREARQLVRKFVSLKDWNVPFFALGLVGCTPAARWLGSLARAAKWKLRA